MRCCICGQSVDQCEGECQEEISLKDKIDYLKSLERRKEDDKIDVVNWTPREW